MSILSGQAIRSAIRTGSIRIDPFDTMNVNSVSVDLTLGERACVYVWNSISDTPQLDARKENPVRYFDLPEDGYEFWPGELYLLHTAERVWSDRYVPILDGKSSIGRLGVSVHVTAGFGDPGFDGQYTLEVTCIHPTRLYAGMRICQMRFETIYGVADLYAGNYQGERAEGPVPSMSWKQFAPEPGK